MRKPKIEIFFEPKLEFSFQKAEYLAPVVYGWHWAMQFCFFGLHLIINMDRVD